MKKNSTPKLFGLALTAALTLTALTACGTVTPGRIHLKAPLTAPTQWYSRQTTEAWARYS